jgi:hypothetical protein
MILAISFPAHFILTAWLMIILLAWLFPALSQKSINIIAYICGLFGMEPDTSFILDFKWFSFQKKFPFIKLHRSWTWYKRLHFSQSATYKNDSQFLLCQLRWLNPFIALHIIIDRFTHYPEKGGWSWKGYLLESIIWCLVILRICHVI